MIRVLNPILAAAAVVSFGAMAAQAEMVTFNAEMTGTAEVPPNDSAATGTAEVTLDTEEKTVTWTYTVDGLSGDVVASHIHGPASATETADPVFDTTAETPEGKAPITDEQIAELMAGLYYFNVHSEQYPDGEIRGQFVMAQ